MIVGTTFDGDNNETVKWIQHDEYKELIWHLFGYAKDEYLIFDWYHKQDPNLRHRIIEIESFDHRVLQASHDLIAASFRYLFCLHDEITEYPQGFEYKYYYLSVWTMYFKKESLILSRNREFQLPILLAIAYQNTEQGYQAEDDLNRRLLDRYPYLGKPPHLHEDLTE